MRKITLIPARLVSPPLRALFDADQPLAIRCFAVLDGLILGQMWTDDLAQPTWGAVQEAAFGTLFLGGRPDASQVHELIERVRQARSVALGLWPDHAYNQLLPPAPDIDGWEVGFTDRPSGASPLPDGSLPAGCELRPIDATWFERCRYRDTYAAFFGGQRERCSRDLASAW